MEKRWNSRYWLLPGLLTIALIAVGVWGYQESRLRQELQNRAESQYQKAYHELTWHLDNISGQLAQALVSSSKEQTVLTLATVWRQVFAAQSNLGGLPLAYVPLSKTEKFLSDTGEVANALLAQTARGQATLQEENSKVLEELYHRSKTLGEELSKLQAKILDRQLSWTRVEVASITGGGNLEDNTILDGFNLMEQRIEEYPEINLNEDFTPVEPESKKMRGKEEIGEQKALQIALDWWFGTPGAHQAKISYEGVGDIPTYGVEIAPLREDEGGPVYVDISKLDGAVIWAMKEKTSENSRLSLSEGEKKGREFLAKHNLEDIVAVKTQKEDNTAVYTFVPRQGDVLLYPDQIKIQVSLEDGEITGYEGTPYYMFNRPRELSAPKLTEKEIKEIVSPRLSIELVRPALIVNTWGKEVLTWEVRGKIFEEQFAIFYDANSGIEENITRITPSPQFTFEVAS
jgi:spore germination protein